MKKGQRAPMLPHFVKSGQVWLSKESWDNEKQANEWRYKTMYAYPGDGYFYIINTDVHDAQPCWRIMHMTEVHR